MNDRSEYMKHYERRKGHAPVADGLVVSIANGVALVRLEGTTDVQRAFVSTDQSIAPGDRVIMVRSPRNSRWTITSSYDRPDTGKSPSKVAIESVGPADSWQIIVPHTAVPAGASSIEMVNISARMKHLKLMLQLRTNRVAIVDEVLIRFNNDSTVANYYNVYQTIYQDPLAATNRVGTVAGIEAPVTGDNPDSGGANIVSTLELTIHGYRNTNTFKSIYGMGHYAYGNTSAHNRTILVAGGYQVLDPIISITIVPITGTAFVVGCYYSLLGMGG